MIIISQENVAFMHLGKLGLMHVSNNLIWRQLIANWVMIDAIGVLNFSQIEASFYFTTCASAMTTSLSTLIGAHMLKWLLNKTYMGTLR